MPVEKCSTHWKTVGLTGKAMQYLRRNPSGTWTFTPPNDCVAAGLMSSKSFDDGRTARFYVMDKMKTIDAFREGRIPPKVLTKDNTVRQLVCHYLPF